MKISKDVLSYDIIIQTVNVLCNIKDQVNPTSKDEIDAIIKKSIKHLAENYSLENIANQVSLLEEGNE